MNVIHPYEAAFMPVETGRAPRKRSAAAKALKFGQ